MTMNIVSLTIIFVPLVCVNLVDSLVVPTNVQKILRVGVGINQQNLEEIRNSLPDSSANSWLSHHRIVEYFKNLDGTAKAKLTFAPKLLHSFKWKKCDSSPSLLNVSSLSIGPDPLQFPGTVYLQFAGTLKENIDAPLKVDVTLKKELTEAFWITVPCVDGIGSCSYDDICEQLEEAQCPKPFVKYGMPCKCPFQKGSYKMLRSGFKAKIHDIPGGNYYFKTTVSYDGKSVMCVEINFSIKES